MTDWDVFTDSIPWFVGDDTTIKLDTGRDPASLASITNSQFPSFAQLIRMAAITSVHINGVPHELFAWDSTDGYRIGWLCLTPPSDRSDNVCDSHRILLRAFGGIVERFNEPDDTRLLNHNSVLTANDASFDASFINDYDWAFDGSYPIDPTDYYCVGREANGNTTICNRVDGSILLFAPDHSFNDVTPFGDCPEYTLYNIHDVSTLTDWVELIARQWLRHTGNVA